MARIGGTLAPVILLLRDTNPRLPFAVWGLLAFSAALATWLLPETLNEPSLEAARDLRALLHGNGCRVLLGKDRLVPPTHPMEPFITR